MVMVMVTLPEMPPIPEQISKRISRAPDRVSVQSCGNPRRRQENIENEQRKIVRPAMFERPWPGLPREIDAANLFYGEVSIHNVDFAIRH
jgi:hypothetical protein